MGKTMRKPDQPKIYRARIDYDFKHYGPRSDYRGPFLRKGLAEASVKYDHAHPSVTMIVIEESPLTWSEVTD